MPDWLTREQRSRNMAAIRSRGTSPERLLGELLRAEFPRRKVVTHPSSLPGRPDFFLPGLRLALFADGCFWHGCPIHGRVPGDNRAYWEPKLARNRARDRKAVRELRRQDVRVLRVWEHHLRRDPAYVRRRLRRVVTASA